MFLGENSLFLEDIDISLRNNHVLGEEFKLPWKAT